jgi:tetratricopeptide (TPR) repeat protein
MGAFVLAGLVFAFLASAPTSGWAQSGQPQGTFGKGMELYQARRYVEAEPFWREAEGRTRVWTRQPPAGHVIDYLANLYRDLGRYAEAEPLYRREVAIYEGALDPDHPHLSAALNNLALLYRHQRRYAEAEPLFVRSVAIDTKALGPDHPRVAMGLDNLAGMYEEQGRYAEAEPLYGRALAVLEKALRAGPP